MKGAIKYYIVTSDLPGDNRRYEVYPQALKLVVKWLTHWQADRITIKAVRHKVK